MQNHKKWRGKNHPYHLGKEMMEKCSFCKIHNDEKEKILT